MPEEHARELIAVLPQIDRQLQELVKTTNAAFTKWDGQATRVPGSD